MNSEPDGQNLMFFRILLILLGLNSICWLIVGTLFAPLFPGGWIAVVLAGVMLLVPLFFLVRGLLGGGYPSTFIRLFVYRPFWYGQLNLPFIAMAGLAGILIGAPFGGAIVVGRWLATVVAVMLFLIAILGFFGSRRLVVRPLEVVFDALPPEFDGLRVVQLSDLHVGPHTSRRRLAKIVAMVRQAAPDMIVFTGDQVDDYARDMEPFAAAFGGLSAPLGIFAIAGNHDIIGGWDEVRSAMERMGITVLVNDAMPLTRGDGRIWIIGTGDPAGLSFTRGGGAGAAPDIDRALRDVPEHAFALALAHNPALWPQLAAQGVDLTLSGHTHYGQFAIPSLNWSLASPFLELAMGTHQRESSILYISCGAHFWGIPLRFGTPAEVVVVTMRRGTERGARAQVG